jgi:hypothetical protein
MRGLTGLLGNRRGAAFERERVEHKDQKVRKVEDGSQPLPLPDLSDLFVGPLLPGAADECSTHGSGSDEALLCVLPLNSVESKY